MFCLILLFCTLQFSFTRFGFRDLLLDPAGPCLDIVQPDIAASGGLTEFSRIATLAAVAGVPLVPHVWGSAVGLAAALHAVGSFSHNFI